jgi:serine/threonine protein phosphatase PrpC
VAECLHDEIDRALARAQSTADWAAAVTSAFSTVDENLMDESESMMWTSGTTVVCAAFHKEERELWVANLGDSRCVLARHDQGGPKVVAEPLSSDHKPWVEGEIQRIERAGCRVTEGRINGTVTVMDVLRCVDVCCVTDTRRHDTTNDTTHATRQAHMR